MSTRGAGRLKAAAVGVSVSLMGYSCLDADATVRSHTTMQGCQKDYSVANPGKPRQAKGLVLVSVTTEGQAKRRPPRPTSLPTFPGVSWSNNCRYSSVPVNDWRYRV